MKKKIYMLIAAALFSTAVTAQDESTESTSSSYFSGGSSSDEQFVSKNGHNVLPEAGDFAIGFNASPFLSYFGDIFGRTASNSSLNNFGFANHENGSNAALYGKYFLDSKTAVRASFEFAGGGFTEETEVANDIYNHPDSVAYDVAKGSNGFHVITVGLEKRRGYGRLQGFYGAELWLMYDRGSRASYEYANEITSANQNPSSTNYGSGGITLPTGFPNQRVISYNQENGFGIGARAFAGVEYFVAPKISLAGEFNWGFYSVRSGRSTVTTEAYSAQAAGPVTFTRETEKEASWEVSTGNLGGAIKVLFHF